MFRAEADARSGCLRGPGPGPQPGGWAGETVRAREARTGYATCGRALAASMPGGAYPAHGGSVGSSRKAGARWRTREPIRKCVVHIKFYPHYRDIGWLDLSVEGLLAYSPDKEPAWRHIGYW